MCNLSLQLNHMRRQNIQPKFTLRQDIQTNQRYFTSTAGQKRLLIIQNDDNSRRYRFIEMNRANVEDKQIVKADAILGLIDLKICSYVIIVTKSKQIAQISNSPIFQALNFELISVNGQSSSKDIYFINGIKTILQSGNYYFSFDYDLTNTLQTLMIASNTSSQVPNKRWEYCANCQHFGYNKNHQEKWFSTFISGYIEQLGFQNISLTIISRTDKRRQGYRWIRRGCDQFGNCANTVETQFIFNYQFEGIKHIFSYCFLRGTMPFLWAQYPCLKLHPIPKVTASFSSNKQIFEQHIKQIQQRYKKVFIVSLVDRGRQQKWIGNYFQNIFKKSQLRDASFYWFQVNKQCSLLNLQNLWKLVELVKSQLDDGGYFHATISEDNHIKIQEQQISICRMNCMDSIDRTNLGQKIISRYILLKWLSIVKMVRQQDNQIRNFLTIDNRLQKTFLQLWRNNGNSLAFQYCGTQAMRSNITANGKVAKKSLIKQALKPLRRFIKSNFWHPLQQDFMDILNLKIKKQDIQKIDHPWINPFFSFAFIMLTMPIVSSEIIRRHYSQKIQAQNLTEKKVLAGILSIIVFWKIAQIIPSFFVKKPFLKDKDFSLEQEIRESRIMKFK